MTNDPTLEVLVSGLRQAAIEAGDFIGRSILQHNMYTEKPIKRPEDVCNPVTEIDKRAEDVTVSVLNKLPIANRLRIYGEEHEYADNGGDIRIDIDPIDGTSSWVRGEFVSAYSIGAHYKDHHVGVVNDFMRGILYATDLKDGKLIATATFKNHGGIERTLPVNEGVLNKTKVLTDDQAQCTKMFGKPSEYKISGSIALAYAHLAYGAIDGIVMKSKLMQYYDISGGLALAKASGVHLVDYDGGKVTPDSFNKGIIALRPHVKVADQQDPRYWHAKMHDLVG